MKKLIKNRYTEDTDSKIKTKDSKTKIKLKAIERKIKHLFSRKNLEKKKKILK